MRTRAHSCLLVVCAVALVGASACDNRGVFTPSACDTGDAPGSRMATPSGAAAAIYVDAEGNPLGIFAEDLYGTMNTKMCPTPPAGGPGGCSPKPPWCTVKINNVNYCVRC